MDELLTIGEFSERCGLSAKMLRNYAGAGLLTPAAVDTASGYRYYAPGQTHEATVIGLLRRAGMSLADIARFLKAPTATRLAEWEAALLADVDVRRGALNEVRKLLALDGAAALPVPVIEGDDGGDVVAAQLMAAAASDVGRVRAGNEDAVLVVDRLIAVADGMGGHAAGEVASARAIEALAAGFDGASVERLVDAARAANRAVCQAARRDPELDGMGTTLCAAAVVATDDGAIRVGIVNVGDSRAYLFRGGELRQLTDDHSLVAELVRAGELDEQEAAVHPRRSVLTRVVGIAPDIAVDSIVVDVEFGDRLVLSTDGLTTEVSDAEIADLLADGADPVAASQRLVDAAVQAGGRDNVSVVVADVVATGH